MMAVGVRLWHIAGGRRCLSAVTGQNGADFCGRGAVGSYSTVNAMPQLVGLIFSCCLDLLCGAQDCIW